MAGKVPRVSINTSAQSLKVRNYCTVAELVERERATHTPYHRRRPRQEDRLQQLQPVTELLRREGIEFEGEDAPTIEMPAATVHAGEVLSRRPEPVPERKEKRRAGKVGAISGAAVLCGLTVAGVIALKPPVTPGPTGTLADAGPGEGATSTTSVGGVTPTSTVLQRAGVPATVADTSDDVTSLPSSGGVGGDVGATQEATQPTTTSGPSRTVAPVPSENDPEPRQSTSPTEENEDDGNDGEGNGNPITDTAKKLKDTVDDATAPVTSTVSGTLDGVLN